MNKLSLEEITERVKDIPPFPETVHRIMQLAESPDSTVQDIEQEVIKDQNLTATILRFANSTHYGYARTISTISQATVILGFQAVKSIAMAASVSRILTRELPGYALERGALETVSNLCHRGQTNCKKVKYPKADEAYVAGLLRDIGKVILDYYLYEQAQEIHHLVEEKKLSFMQAEEKVLGFHHGQVGASIAKKWNLPEDLVESIALHHEPKRAATNPRLVAITHLADALVMMMGQVGSDGLSYAFSDEALEMAGVSSNTLEQILSDLAELLRDEDAFQNK